MTAPARPRRRRTLLALAAMAVAVIVFPFEHEVTPAWTLSVTDASSRAIEGCRIEQHWEWLAVGVQQSDVAQSNVVGGVTFPRRTARASFARQWWGQVSGITFHGPSLSRRAYFLGCGAGTSPEMLGVGQEGDRTWGRYVPGVQGVIKPITPAR